ncbi:MAG: hypothetical protein AB8I08_38060 [Sandaracinaceae bacterium]
MKSRFFALCCVFAASITTGCGESAPPTEAERRMQRMDRTSVHVHVTLRDQLDSDGATAVAGRLARAGSNRTVADQLGQSLFEERETGANRLRARNAGFAPVARLRVPSSTVSGASDTAGYFLALVEAGAEDERRIPKQVLVYEAQHLELDAVSDAGLRSMARAAAALVFSRAGYCERVDALSTQSNEGAGRAGLAAAVIMGGAVACCTMRRHRLEDAADVIDGWLDEAEELGLHAASLELLRVWTELARNDAAQARTHLEAAREAGVQAPDRGHYEMLRDAVARTDREGSFEPSEGTLDRRWLSALVLAFAHRALGEDGWMGEEMGGRPEARALRELAEGEAAVIAAARARYPMFDLAQEADRSTSQRLADLFR